MSLNRIFKSIRKNIKAILIVLLIILNLILLFKPNLFNNKASIVGVREKSKELQSLNDKLEGETEAGGRKRTEIARLKVEDNELEKQANINKIEIDPTGLEFHLPSILIRLEDSSKRNNLKLSINYNGIAYENIQGEEIKLEEEDKEEDNEEETSDETKNSKSSSENKIEEKEQSKEETKKEKKSSNAGYNLYLTPEEMKGSEKKTDEDGNSIDEIDENAKRYSDRGIEVTTIPIEVTGTYDGVKAFIKDLDRFNYLEPTKIDINSLGDNVDAKIVISVFHGDIFK